MRTLISIDAVNIPAERCGNMLMMKSIIGAKWIPATSMREWQYRTDTDYPFLKIFNYFQEPGVNFCHITTFHITSYTHRKDTSSFRSNRKSRLLLQSTHNWAFSVSGRYLSGSSMFGSAGSLVPWSEPSHQSAVLLLYLPGFYRRTNKLSF